MQQQIFTQLYLIFVFILIDTLVVAQYPINQGAAMERDIPIEFTIDNHYSRTDYQFPNSEWQTVEAINPIWIHFPASTRHRQIVASTCTTEIDTIVGIYYYYQSHPVGYLNDDRINENLSNRCFLLSSYVSTFIPREMDFYVVVASFNSVNNLGVIDLKVYQDFQNIFPTQVIIDAIHEENARLTARINDIYDSYLLLHSDFASNLDDNANEFINGFGELEDAFLLSEYNLFTNIDAFENELVSKISELSNALDMKSLITTTEYIDNLVNQIEAELLLLQTKFLSIELEADQLRGFTLELNINYQDLDFTQRFNNIDSSISSIHGDTNDLQTQLSELQIIAELNNDFLENQLFAKYLLANDNKSKMKIPKRYLTPSKYLGNMEDILDFVVHLYEEKVAYCELNKSTIGCIWFKKNTKNEYNRMTENYNRYVGSNQFMRAFGALQRFYRKLYPIRLFNRRVPFDMDDRDGGKLSWEQNSWYRFEHEVSRPPRVLFSGRISMH